jgi:lipopolysaccharide biosynthesis glycosyltransferase
VLHPNGDKEFQAMPHPPIVCGVDDQYADVLQALIRSIAAVHGSGVAELRMIVLHTQLTRPRQQSIAATAEQVGLDLDFFAVDAASHPVSKWISEAAYLRLAIPEAATGTDRALYLDCDTLVLDDLRSLLDTDLGGAPLGAVRDAHNPTVGQGWALPGHATLGIPAGRTYFNSGVLLFDLERCAAMGLFEKATRFLTDHPEQVLLWDQDALNVAADDEWHRLDPVWNTFATSPLTLLPDFFHHAEATPLADLLADEAHAKILHYAGPDKPWQDTYPAHPLRERWRAFANGSQ